MYSKFFLLKKIVQIEMKYLKRNIDVLNAIVHIYICLYIYIYVCQCMYINVCMSRVRGYWQRKKRKRYMHVFEIFSIKKNWQIEMKLYLKKKYRCFECNCTYAIVHMYVCRDGLGLGDTGFLRFGTGIVFFYFLRLEF